MKTRRRAPQELGVLVVVLLVAVIMGVLSPEFRTAGNMEVLLLNGSVVTFLALGQTCVLLTGGIDLSVGSNIAFTGMVAALAMQAGMPWWAAALLAILTGAGVGVFERIGHSLRSYAAVHRHVCHVRHFGVDSEDSHPIEIHHRD